MGNVAFVLSEGAYYGFRLVGFTHCFLCTDATSTRRALNAVKNIADISLVIIEKKLTGMLTKDEKNELILSESPFFFEIDTEMARPYGEELENFVKQAGVYTSGG